MTMAIPAIQYKIFAKSLEILSIKFISTMFQKDIVIFYFLLIWMPAEQCLSYFYEKSQ